MSHPIVSDTRHTFAQRDVLSVQAGLMLQTTAREWGMCADVVFASAPALPFAPSLAHTPGHKAAASACPAWPTRCVAA